MTTNKTIWRPIKGYEGLYCVSNKGKVKTLHTKYSNCKSKRHYLSPLTSGAGYQVVGLTKSGITKQFLIHRLVAEAFIENPNNYPFVNHKDENKKNNNVDNLEWCTPRQNLEFSNVILKLRIAGAKSQCKKVAMYKDGIFLQEFESATAAARFIGDYQQNVSKCCHGEIKRVRGYQFKFVNN